MKSLTFHNVSFAYNAENKIFSDTSFTLQNPHADSGHIIALMGASGTGKSTLLKLMLRLLIPQQGSIISTPASPLISYVPQEGVLFDHLSPMENARYFSRTSAYKKHFNEPLFQQFSEVLGMASFFKTSRSVQELSGGQRQRLSLLRALSINPDILLLDEPTTGLDADVKLQFLLKLREIVKEQGLLAIYVSHHKIEAELIVDGIAYLARGDDGINHLYQNDLLTFTAMPPVAEAVKVLNYPKPNLISCSVASGWLQIHEEAHRRTDLIGIKPSNMTFTNDGGVPCKLVTKNAIYTTISIPGGQNLTFESGLHDFQEGNSLQITGEVLQYNRLGIFQGTLTLRNNSVTDFLNVKP